jgi:hypothetical protein
MNLAAAGVAAAAAMMSTNATTTACGVAAAIVRVCVSFLNTFVYENYDDDDDEPDRTYSPPIYRRSRIRREDWSIAI